MSYTPTTWQGKPSTATPITAARLNKLENGLASAAAVADEALATEGAEVTAAVVDPIIQAYLAENDPVTPAKVNAVVTHPAGGKMVAAGIRVAIGGESHAGGASGFHPIAWSPTEPLSWAHFISNGRFQYVGNAGVSSTSVDNFLSRTDRGMAAIESLKPDVYIHLGGSFEANPSNSVTFAAFKTAIQTVVSRCRALNILPVLATTYPTTTTGSFQANVERQNTWLRLWCAANSVPLFDTFTPLVGALDGGIQAALADVARVHANAAGNRILGQKLWTEILSRILPAWEPPIAKFNSATNMVPNAVTMTDSDSDGLPNSWVLGSSPAGISQIEASSIAGANWVRCNDNGNNSSLTMAVPNYNLAAWTAGDRIAFTGRLKHVNGTSDKTGGVQVNFSGGSPNSVRPLSAWSGDVEGDFYVETEIPSGTTNMSVNILRSAGTAGTGYTALLRPTLINLTKQGSILS